MNVISASICHYSLSNEICTAAHMPSVSRICTGGIHIGPIRHLQRNTTNSYGRCVLLFSRTVGSVVIPGYGMHTIAYGRYTYIFAAFEVVSTKPNVCAYSAQMKNKQFSIFILHSGPNTMCVEFARAVAVIIKWKLVFRENGLFLLGV